MGIDNFILWFEEPEPLGRTVVVDLDGTLANISHRLGLIAEKPKQWDKYYKAAAKDLPYAGAAALLKVLDPEISIAIVTARPQEIADITVEWLDRYQIPWTLMLMRAEADYRPAFKVKTEAILALAANKADIVCALDDDDDVIEAYKGLSVPVIFVHPED